VSTVSGNIDRSCAREIRASITSFEARLAIVADAILAEMHERYWHGYWRGSRAFLGSVKSAAGGGVT